MVTIFCKIKKHNFRFNSAGYLKIIMQKLLLPKGFILFIILFYILNNSIAQEIHLWENGLIYSPKTILRLNQVSFTNVVR